MGLVSAHAYSFLDFKSIQHEGVELELVKMRNPWSLEHYTGPWRDNDPNWTDALKEELGWVSSNDGVFWMTFDDYYRIFGGSSVTYYDKYEAY